MQLVCYPTHPPRALPSWIIRANPSCYHYYLYTLLNIHSSRCTLGIPLGYGRLIPRHSNCINHNQSPIYHNLEYGGSIPPSPVGLIPRLLHLCLRGIDPIRVSGINPPSISHQDMGEFYRNIRKQPNKEKQVGKSHRRHPVPRLRGINPPQPGGLIPHSPGGFKE